MFVLNSDITIGNFRFSGVNEIYIKRSMYSITDTAVIKLPSKAKVVANGKVNTSEVITGKQFSDGDPVAIKLGYNGDLQTEFVGFVKRRNLNVPLEIECEGYSWLLKRNTVNDFWSSITIKDLLSAAVSGIDSRYSIRVQCDLDFELSNVMAAYETGIGLINKMHKCTDNSLTCFFTDPGVLWCGSVYTPCSNGSDVFQKGTIDYRLGYNVPLKNNLQERFAEDDPVEVKYSKKLSGGEKILKKSTAFRKVVRTYSKILNQVSDKTTLEQLANEKARQLNFTGYVGCVNAFLQPYCAPGYVAYVADDRYPERNGKYLVTGV
jgi:hypothetical protein